MKRLIDCGSRVNTTDLNGNMPLHLALYTAIDDEDVQTIHLLCVAGKGFNKFGIKHSKEILCESTSRSYKAFCVKITYF